MKRCFTFLLIVFTLFLVACTSVQEQAPSPAVQEEEVLAEARLAVQAWNCEGDDFAPGGGECGVYKAVILENATFCELLDENWKPQCLAAMKKCEALSSASEKDQCYFEKMQARINPTSSYKLGGKFLAPNCDSMSNTISEGFPVPLKDVCWSYIATFFGEPEFCENAQGSPDFNVKNFKVECYSGVASSYSYPNFDVCDKANTLMIELGLQGGPDTCWLNILSSRVKDVAANFPPEVYSYYTTNSIDKDDPRINPIEKQAIASNNENLCSSITEKMSRSGCYALIAIKKLEPKLCSLIELSQQRKDCLVWVSLAKKDTTVCELEESVQDKDWCYYTYGRTYLDQTACNQVKNIALDRALNRDECLTYIDSTT